MACANASGLTTSRNCSRNWANFTRSSALLNPSSPTSWRARTEGSLSNAITVDCTPGTRPHPVSRAAGSSARAGNPFSKDFCPSRSTSSDTLPKSMYKSPPLPPIPSTKGSINQNSTYSMFDCSKSVTGNERITPPQLFAGN